MVLSERWNVTDDDLSAHIAALQNGEQPDLLADSAGKSFRIGQLTSGASAEIGHLDTSSPPALGEHGVGSSPQRLAGTYKQPCPQLGLPLKSPRQSKTFGITGFSSLATSYTRDGMSVKRNKEAGATRLDLLNKPDTIPCIHNGKRFNGALNGRIRIYIRMPSINASISMWVDPHLYVHPVAPVALSTSERSAAVAPGSLASARFSESAQARSAAPVHQAESLQDVIAECTGVPVSQQHLRIGTMRIDLNSESHVPAGSTVRDIGLSHGSTIMMHETNLDVHERLVQQAHQNMTSGAWVMPRWQSSPNPKTFGNLPDGGYLSSANIFFHNYCELPDLGATDPCDTIRGHFTPRR